MGHAALSGRRGKRLQLHAACKFRNTRSTGSQIQQATNTQLLLWLHAGHTRNQVSECIHECIHECAHIVHICMSITVSARQTTAFRAGSIVYSWVHLHLCQHFAAVTQFTSLLPFLCQPCPPCWNWAIKEVIFETNIPNIYLTQLAHCEPRPFGGTFNTLTLLWLLLCGP